MTPKNRREAEAVANEAVGGLYQKLHPFLMTLHSDAVALKLRVEELESHTARARWRRLREATKKLLHLG